MTALAGTHPPLSRRDFEEKNRRIARGGEVAPAELESWQRTRDWVARSQLLREGRQPSGRLTPRAVVSHRVHLAAVGPVVTENIGFAGFALSVGRGHGILPGDETSVRLATATSSIYALGRVAWIDARRVGVAIEVIHPGDERALQALVCQELLDPSFL